MSLRFSYFATLLGILFCFTLLSCQKKSIPYNQKIPPIMLWAWEREEDLRFINSDKVGVAFLAQTLVLQSDEVKFIPRRQPMQVNENTYLMAVTRIETNKSQKPTLSDAQKSEMINLILKTLQKKNVKSVQIDFDVIVQERDFYRKLLNELRPKIDKEIPLTITSLASFCIGDNWYGDLPIDEGVPMIFRMGVDSDKIKSYLISGKDFVNPYCKTSYGFSFDEPIKFDFKENRRFYFFNTRSWRPTDLEQIYEITKIK
jgi:hypothetical protein